MTRFVHSFKLKDVPSEEFEAALKELNSQHRVAEHYGVSQMTVSRHMRRLGLKHDGKIQANKEKAKDHSQKMKDLYASGKLTPPMKGKKLSEEHAAALHNSSRGKPSWNSGKRKEWTLSNCKGCGKEFGHSKKRARRFCGRRCSGLWVSRMHKEGLYAHIKQGRGNGGWHNGKWMRSSWEIEFAKRIDKADIAYEHEPKAFHLRDGSSYRPDFWIPEKRLWVEVKGHWWPKAWKKFNMFLEDFPDERMIVLREELWHKDLDL